MSSLKIMTHFISGVFTGFTARYGSQIGYYDEKGVLYFSVSTNDDDYKLPREIDTHFISETMASITPGNKEKTAEAKLSEAGLMIQCNDGSTAAYTKEWLMSHSIYDIVPAIQNVDVVNLRVAKSCSDAATRPSD